MSGNEIWAVSCLVLAGIFFVFGLVFAVCKEKGAMLVSGFNTLPKEERDRYDKKRISRDMRNAFFLWSGVLAAGTVFSVLVHGIVGAVAMVVWLILFFREVHLDAHKAFEKYKK